MRTAASLLALSQRAPARCLATRAADTPMIMKATVDGYGEKATTLVSKEQFSFLVDEPPKLGGLGKGPNPLSLLLGALVGCTQYTCHTIAREQKLGGLGSVAWAASGEYDLRGVRGTDPGVDARFRRVTLQGTVEGELSQEALDSLAQQVDRRCIVAATLKASGLEMQLSLKKGQVDHEREPACAFHELTQGSGGSSGQVNRQGGREADSPKFVGTGGRGKAKASARGFSTLLPYGRGLHTCGYRAQGKDGEDVAREHLKGTDSTPQLQKGTSLQEGAESTRGGAYASRDDPRAQAAPPTEGKSQGQIVQEQSAASTAHPEGAGNAEGGVPMASPEGTVPGPDGKSASSAPEFAEHATDSAHKGRSPLGDQPSGAE